MVSYKYISRSIVDAFYTYKNAAIVLGISLNCSKLALVSLMMNANLEHSGL